jgi:putative Mg2+ transporter-C (MgtC) family protein
MPAHVTWEGIALRLVLTLIAGVLIGLDRSKHEHPAGLRTTLLVTLAASVSMIQMNLLIPTNGKPSDSYAVMDLMRLPLGILTGVGFIGAGAIVKRGNIVMGLTTAATMWFATVVGLCMGGGQIILGSVSTALGCIVLWNLKWFEEQLHKTQRASLIVTAKRGSWTEAEFRSMLDAAAIKVKTLGMMAQATPEPAQTFECEVQWRPQESHGQFPEVLKQIESHAGMISLTWKPVGAPPG